MARTEIRPAGKKLRLSKVDVDASMADKESYEKRLADLQTQMLRIQQAIWHQKRRAVIVLEGWDAAGKGGAIRRMTEPLDPRGVRVYPIGAPTAEEQGRHYLWRFWQRLPVPGEIAIFDRSWYGRVLVERVEGFCDKSAWKRAYEEINEFERFLHDDGVMLVKLFLHISKDEQLKRFIERIENPHKNWKIGPDDLRNRDRWDDYVKAIEAMFDETSTAALPWHVVGANRKWSARVRVLEHVTERLTAGVDLDRPMHDPAFHAEAARRLGVTLEKPAR
ncbi:polyphosphate kinase [Myxococcota bacterium]|nr:polyphosphate kinase [Myxococcota bacterium]